MSLGRRYSPGMVLAPKMSSPLVPSENSPKTFIRSLREDRILKAYFLKISPALVRRTSLLVRSKRRKDRDLSNKRMWPLTVGWVRNRSSAALEKLLSSATRLKVSRCRKSICDGFFSTTGRILTPFPVKCKQDLNIYNRIK